MPYIPRRNKKKVDSLMTFTFVSFIYNAEKNFRMHKRKITKNFDKMRHTTLTYALLQSNCFLIQSACQLDVNALKAENKIKRSHFLHIGSKQYIQSMKQCSQLMQHWPIVNIDVPGDCQICFKIVWLSWVLIGPNKHQYKTSCMRRKFFCFYYKTFFFFLSGMKTTTIKHQWIPSSRIFFFWLISPQTRLESY